MCGLPQKPIDDEKIKPDKNGLMCFGHSRNELWDPGSVDPFWRKFPEAH